MKFLVFATGALATLTSRQVSVVSDAIQAISSATASLGVSVNKFANISDVAPLTLASTSLLNTVKSRTEAVLAIPQLSDNDALSLAVPISELNNDAGASIDALIAKKEAFVTLRVGSVVYGQLTQLRAASTNFSDATISKVSRGLQSIARTIAAPVLENIDRGIAAYEDQVPAASRTSFAPPLPTATGGAVANAAGLGAIAAAAAAFVVAAF